MQVKGGKKMKLLLTGATGKLGTKIAECLLTKVPAESLAVSVRDPKKAEWLRAKGVDVRHGDFDHPETLDTAFAGVDRLLIISADGDNETRIRQHTAAVAAAQRAKVGFIAYTSVVNARESILPLALPHRATEEAIQKTGIPYAILRNNWYLENEIGNILAVKAGRPWVTATGKGRVGWALRQDYAEAAATVLAEEGHENTIYELSGNLMTVDELASAVGDLIGIDVEVQHLDEDEYAAMMKNTGVPESALPFLLELQRGIREGALDVESNDFEKLLGRPVTPTKEALRQILNDLEKTGN